MGPERVFSGKTAHSVIVQRNGMSSPCVTRRPSRRTSIAGGSAGHSRWRCDGRHWGRWTPRPWSPRPPEAITPMVAWGCPNTPGPPQGRPRERSPPV